MRDLAGSPHAGMDGSLRRDRGVKPQASGGITMRASVLLIFAVVIAALLLAFDAYEYDGHYRKATVDQVEHEVGSLLGR